MDMRLGIVYLRAQWRRFVVSKPIDGKPAHANGGMIGFSMSGRE
jgi:hypothetical protein